jgi:heme/copper-type cytochrome/quinol oxidase subunit 2
MVAEEDLPRGSFRLLEVTERLILPSFLPLEFLISSTDVIHSFSIPAFGVKMDAVPGRINSVTTVIRMAGVTYYGQCSELCGINHSFMPIAVDVVVPSKFINFLHEPLRPDNFPKFHPNVLQALEDAAAAEAANATPTVQPAQTMPPLKITDLLSPEDIERFTNQCLSKDGVPPKP